MTTSHISGQVHVENSFTDSSFIVYWHNFAACRMTRLKKMIAENPKNIQVVNLRIKENERYR